MVSLECFASFSLTACYLYPLGSWDYGQVALPLSYAYCPIHVQQIKNSKSSPVLPVLGFHFWFKSTLFIVLEMVSHQIHTNCLSTQFSFAWTLVAIGLLSSGILSHALDVALGLAL